MITHPQIPDPYAAPLPPMYSAPQVPQPDKASAWKKILVALATVAVLGSMIFGGIMLKSVHDQQERNDEAASSSSAAASSSSAAATSSARAAEQAVESERSRRRAAAHDIEASVRQMANEHVASGFIVGPILLVTCDPVTGGVEDITLETTTFSCFVTTEVTTDGRSKGFYYHATMSWTSGRYTYGYGAPS
ncbi:DUF2510 domain-containing protein [Smaragdicoccus niigatensis]|uniref:DUF2510 domain-containing protein n=1 Tax=Smaragdicoccus niigatensis TaxID=359359 RepID=UPI0003A62123|nr:DUF2510 domain-containing protein [Smaragdicoccus niigatensis]